MKPLGHALVYAFTWVGHVAGGHTALRASGWGGRALYLTHCEWDQMYGRQPTGRMRCSAIIWPVNKSRSLILVTLIVVSHRNVTWRIYSRSAIYIYVRSVPSADIDQVCKCFLFPPPPIYMRAASSFRWTFDFPRSNEGLFNGDVMPGRRPVYAHAPTDRSNERKLLDMILDVSVIDRRLAYIGLQNIYTVNVLLSAFAAIEQAFIVL